RQALRAEPGLQPILDWWKTSFAQFDSGEPQAQYQRQLQQWRQLAAKAKRENRKAPARPKKLEDPRQSRHRPASLYNGMIAPLVPYRLRGIISYQGLGNLYWAKHSRLLMSTMVRDWRSQWKQPALPFGMVQPAPYPCDNWAKLESDAYSLQREGQLLLLDELPHTGIAPTTDIGDLNELHFTNKQAVGRRMASWALATVYDKSIPYSGPIYQSMKTEGSKIRIQFRHVGSGLKTSDGREPTHFVIAGADKQFQPAQAVIDGNSVLVSNRSIAKPVAVRFAWSDTAMPNLFNSDGLPASVFRTDVPSLHELLPKQ
ncbi:MAG: sialate O-acetylesterase, partial [Planctomycetaceae bacterium]|nr:sialate O-acetylesterase [Planctomycetaceae bacterium]